MITQGRDRSSLGNSTLRSIADTTLNMSIVNRKLDKNPRINNFLGSVKEQLKISVQPAHQQTKVQVNSQQQLQMIARKYYLPYELQI